MAVLGLSLTAIVSLGSVWRGFLSATLGVLISTVGAGIFGGQRYTFGQDYLLDGIDFIPAMIGLFGLAEALRGVRGSGPSVSAGPVRIELPFGDALRQIARHPRLMLQSSLTGTVVGAVPGAGADVAAWVSYGIAERTSRRRGYFGRGELEGIIAPTTANNAAVAGAWIPALVFGVPGDAVTAIVLGALMMHGIQPGPEVFINNAHEIQGVFAIALTTQFLLIPAGLIGIYIFGWMLRMPSRIVLSIVILSSVVGSYALQLSVFDVVVMFAFGLLGLLLESQRVPLVPLILGMILGPYLEVNLRSGLIRSQGDWRPFVFDPECAVMIALLVVAFLFPAMRLVRREVRRWGW
jgi:TctA family transporter